MAKRASYKHDHAGTKRRRIGALGRLEAQLTKLTAKDTTALFSTVDKPTDKDFSEKSKYVKQQIANIKSNGV